ncbi:hypothetical protein B8A32_03705 [Loigolactobacillus backii]|nr:hypothetical protein ACX53_01470 [Loigolactobacillus backii]PIO88182.1 hypothetical protein B8A32_03705 [Loigolactobacillus backii]
MVNKERVILAKKHIYFMDLLNIIGMLAVVFLHSSEYAFTYHPGNRWGISLVLQVGFIFAVPLFLMLSGANILNYRERYSTTVFAKKRISKVLLPFIFWSLAWFAYDIHQGWQQATWQSLFDGFTYNKFQPIFWFFYTIMGFYLAAPILSQLTQRANKRIIQYFLGLYIVVVLIGSYGLTLIPRPQSIIFSSIPMVATQSIGYFLVGWYVQEFPLTKQWRHQIQLLGGLSLLIMLGLAFGLSLQRHYMVRNVYTIFSIFAFFYSLSIWVSLENWLANWQPRPWLQPLLRNLASASLGVYCIHEFLIYSVEQYWKLPASSYTHMFLLPVAVYLVSVVITLLLKRIPLIRRLIP